MTRFASSHFNILEIPETRRQLDRQESSNIEIQWLGINQELKQKSLESNPQKDLQIYLSLLTASPSDCSFRQLPKSQAKLFSKMYPIRFVEKFSREGMIGFTLSLRQAENEAWTDNCFRKRFKSQQHKSGSLSLI